MADSKMRIGDQWGTLFRDGVSPIYLLHDGRFAVMWGDQWKIRPSLKAIEKVIAVERSAIKITKIGYFPRNSGILDDTATVDAAEFLEAKIIDKDGKRHHKGYGGWYVSDPQREEAIADLAKRMDEAWRAFSDEYDAIMKDAKRVTVPNFKELLEDERQD